MRSRLVNGYNLIGIDLLWDTIAYDLPQPIALVEVPVKQDQGLGHRTWAAVLNAPLP